MSKGGFQRVGEPISEGLIRGPARVLIEPASAVYPSSLSKIVNLAATGYTTEEQELTKFSEVANEGSFNLGFNSYETANIKYNATPAEIQAALEALAPIGEGGVKCEGTKPLTEEVIKIKFSGELAELAQPLIVIAQNNCKKTSVAVTFEVKRLVAGFGLYDPVGAWTELGSTKGGVDITRNNTESIIDIDQIQAAILSIPDEWSMDINCPLANTSLENIQFAWEGGEIKTDVTQTPNERTVGMGNPLNYEERRMAILHQKRLGNAAGKIRGVIFRRVLHSPSASKMDFMKTGPQQILPLAFKAFADTTVPDPKYSMGEVREQSVFK